MGVERETERSQAQKERTRLLDKQYKKPTNIKLHNHLTHTTLPETFMWLKRQIQLHFFCSKRLTPLLHWTNHFFNLLTAKSIVCILKKYRLGYLHILVHTTNYGF